MGESLGEIDKLFLCQGFSCIFFLITNYDFRFGVKIYPVKFMSTVVNSLLL